MIHFESDHEVQWPVPMSVCRSHSGPGNEETGSLPSTPSKITPSGGIE
jgi:hypothetical protein